MDWDEAEWPDALLRGRVAQVAAACAAQDVDALLLYTGFTRPAQVSALTHFVPFWSQALLAITRSGESMLTMATTGRTVQWIRSVSRVDEVIVGPELGASAGQWLAGREHVRRVALAAPDDWPQSAHAGLRRTLPQAELEAADPWLAALESSFDPPPRVLHTANTIADSAIALVCSGAGWSSANELVAALDGHCRALGAEEVSVHLAPDLSLVPTPHRLEGPTELGSRFGVRLTLAYKGHWLRAGTSFSATGATVAEHPACAEARRALRDAAACSRRVHALLEAVQQASAARVDDWHLESRRGGLPLASVSASDLDGAADAPGSSTFSARLSVDGLPLILSTPL
jgi:hypothetical protein